MVLDLAVLRRAGRGQSAGGADPEPRPRLAHRCVGGHGDDQPVGPGGDVERIGDAFTGVVPVAVAVEIDPAVNSARRRRDEVDADAVGRTRRRRQRGEEADAVIAVIVPGGVLRIDIVAQPQGGVGGDRVTTAVVGQRRRVRRRGVAVIDVPDDRERDGRGRRIDVPGFGRGEGPGNGEDAGGVEHGVAGRVERERARPIGGGRHDVRQHRTDRDVVRRGDRDGRVQRQHVDRRRFGDRRQGRVVGRERHRQRLGVAGLEDDALGGRVGERAGDVGRGVELFAGQRRGERDRVGRFPVDDDGEHPRRKFDGPDVDPRSADAGGVAGVGR